ncbi:pimeloyl-ACP methyl ester carboxylesterase/uncharacterized protein YukE [Crossiella equi]|uniref:Pimeloyl-ACP methyl ester carboxylesterase/uncharacterized protein YukE n=1 Tax=Crossiella equi TaxID=130796 RepID=A0ABS5AK36_9PSEU|nr:alpha/beta hydrolase [Crossiella equi]MBP2476574.1 pimeloyl-ACP methyl ester carboxylesterase/uncharacterized protein YukE [Crossiella equi]
MTTVPELRDAEPSVFTRAAQRWQDLATSLTTRADETHRVVKGLADWRGEAALTAHRELARHRARLDELAKGLGDIPQVLRTAGERLTHLQTALRTALATAHANQLRVATDGQVTDDAVAVATPPSPNRPNRAELCATLTTNLHDTLRQATEADEEAAAALRRITQLTTGMAPGGIDVCTPLSASIPAAGTSPAEVKKWWDGLSIADRESVLATDAARIGALDGIPAIARDRANRTVLAELRAELGGERTRLEAKSHRTPDDEKRLEELRKKLGGLDAVANRLAEPVTAAKQQAFLLGVNADGNGRAVVAMGNPDTATNVATLVPGTGSSLAEGGAYLDRADSMLEAAAVAGSPSTAVVSWVGYDSPPDVPGAMSESYAADGKQSLARFQEGLRATHEGQPSHNTVVGHSYGSTLVGHAARDLGLKADELVFIGSPGVGVERADQLNIPPERVHASVAQNDMIKASNVMPSPGFGAELRGPHGPDPTAASFGGRPFTSDPGTANPLGLPSIAAHMQYWEHDSKSLNNMGRVIAGKPTV